MPTATETKRRGRILAGLDLGTNSTLFLLAEVAPDGRIRPLRHEVRTNDLGRGLNDDGCLSPEVIELNLNQLADFRREAEKYGAEAIRIGATQALRIAKNAAVLIRRAKEELNLDIRILSGEEEALLTFRGVVSGLENPREGILLADVGGGSTEIILGENGAVRTSVSLPIGAVTLQRRFIRQDPPGENELQALRGHLEDRIGDLSAFRRNSGAQLILCGGTASALAAADLNLTEYQPEKIAGHRLSLKRLRRFIADFSRMTLEERRAVPGIGRRRAEIILPGTMILQTLLEKLGREAYTTSERGLRYGLLLLESGASKSGKAKKFA
jgi:exopolyphosphatase/guanosine-5'-triphosphate,3'-diphosphate pyrophosphatase